MEESVDKSNSSSELPKKMSEERDCMVNVLEDVIIGIEQDSVDNFSTTLAPVNGFSHRKQKSNHLVYGKKKLTEKMSQSVAPANRQGQSKKTHFLESRANSRFVKNSIVDINERRVGVNSAMNRTFTHMPSP